MKLHSSGLYRTIVLILCLGFVNHIPDANATQFRVFGGYGFEEKFDTLDDLVTADNYIAIMVNVNDALEVQAMPINGDGRGGGTHFSANYHFVLSKHASFSPFANFGIGLLTVFDDSLHLNLDAGIQFGIRRFKLRVFHKSQNRFWGDTNFGTSAFIFALGVTIR